MQAPQGKSRELLVDLTMYRKSEDKTFQLGNEAGKGALAQC